MEEFVRGTCMGMCPEMEILTRMERDLVHVLELEDPLKSKRADPLKMVKCFRRSAAGVARPAPRDIRPPPVLQATIRYLLSEVMENDKVPFYVIYDYVSDRIRAIRQDMIIQQIPPTDSVGLLEPMIRFYTYSAYRLGGKPVNEFDSAVNYQHLLECLKWLLNLYDECEHSSIERIEMESLYILLHLGNLLPLQRSISLPKYVRHDVLNMVENMSLLWSFGNYFRVCRCFIKLPLFLKVAFVTSQLPVIRRNTLEVMNTAYSCKNSTYPTAKLSTLLSYNSEKEVVEDCLSCGLTISDSAVHFLKNSFKVNAGKLTFRKLKEIDNQLTNLSLSDFLLSCQFHNTL